MSEKMLCKVPATVMIYNEQERQWFHAGQNSSSSPYSDIHILYNEQRLSYRIVGMKTEDSTDVTVNMNVMKKLKYHVATPTFHQWRCDKRTVYGLNFENVNDADNFKGYMTRILAELNCRQPTNVPNVVNKSNSNLAADSSGKPPVAQNSYENLALNGHHSSSKSNNSQNSPKNVNGDSLAPNGLQHQHQHQHQPLQLNGHSQSHPQPNSYPIEESNANLQNHSASNSNLQKQQYQQYQQQNSNYNTSHAGRPQIPNVSGPPTMSNHSMTSPNGNGAAANMNAAMGDHMDMLKELDRIQDLEMERAMASQNSRPFRQNSQPQSQHQQQLQAQLQPQLQPQLQSQHSHSQASNLQQQLQSKLSAKAAPAGGNPAYNPSGSYDRPPVPSGGPPPPPGPPPPNGPVGMSLSDQIKKQKSLNAQSESRISQKPSDSSRPLSGGDFLSELTRKLKKKSDTTEPNVSALVDAGGDSQELSTQPSRPEWQRITNSTPKLEPPPPNKYQSPLTASKPPPISNGHLQNQHSLNQTQNNHHNSSPASAAANNPSGTSTLPGGISYQQLKEELKQEICQELRLIMREELSLFLSKLAN